MTTPKHTADTWTACFSRVSGTVTNFLIAGQQYGSTSPIAEGPERHKFSPAELEANAHLIAAAPDTKRELENSTRFLEALQILIPDEPEWMDLTLQTIQQIKDNKATIAKAEGDAR